MSQAMMYPQMLEYFQQNGVVESNSPKNRKKLYQQLEKNGIKWNTEIIGYTTGGKELCRWRVGRKLGWNLLRVVKWIQEERLLSDDLEVSCSRCSDRFNFEDIKKVFDKNLSNKDRHEIFVNKWEIRLGALNGLHLIIVFYVRQL